MHATVGKTFTQTYPWPVIKNGADLSICDDFSFRLTSNSIP